MSLFSQRLRYLCNENMREQHTQHTVLNLSIYNRVGAALEGNEMRSLQIIYSAILIKIVSALTLTPPSFYSKIISPIAKTAADYASSGESVLHILDAQCVLGGIDYNIDGAHDKKKYEAATFAGGCFWGVQLAYDNEPGVIASCVGYTQGHAMFPSYAEVCAEETSHTEACLVVFDPEIVAYARLAEVMFGIIPDPTTLNRVGKDRGTQYRTGLYAHSDHQLLQSQEAYDKENRMWKTSGRTVMTEVKMAQPFWPAEEEHQSYLEKNTGGRCS